MLIVLKIFRGQKMKIYLLKLRQLVPVILFTLLMTSCATQTTLLNESYDAEVMETGNDAFFIGGIGQTARHDLNEACQDGYIPAKTQTVLSVPNWLLGVLTLGIYTPRQYTIYCTKETKK
jgi:hypothetical protein